MSTITLWLATALACGPATGDDGPFDADFMSQMTADALVALERGPKISLPEPVEVVLLTEKEATARRRAYHESLGDEVGYTAALDAMADIMFQGNLLGRYLPDERAVYVIEDTLWRQAGGDEGRAEEILFPVLVHEIVHAYDHQVYDAVPEPDNFDELLKDPAALGSIQALMSLIEGRATYASELACEAVGRKPLRSRTVEQALDAKYFEGEGGVIGDAGALFGNSIVRMKLVQYAYGREFSKRVYDFGGEPFFDNVFGSRPLSMAEIEDFGLFVMRWAEDMEAAEEAADGEGAAQAADDADDAADDEADDEDAETDTSP